jgi:hypothetical protein
MSGKFEDCPNRAEEGVDWLTRMKESFKSVGTGLLLFVRAPALLFWNGGNAVEQARLFYRPLIGRSLLAGAVLDFGVVAVVVRRKKEAAEAV